MSLKKINDFYWELSFTQSNSYALKRIKTKNEYENGVENPEKKSNMKIITINKDDVNGLFEFFNWEKNIYPQYIRDVTINKKELMSFLNDVKNELINYSHWFRGGVDIFDIDEDILNAKEIIKGVIKIDLRSKKRTEVVAAFGNFNNVGNFVYKKIKNNHDMVFNHVVFSSCFDVMTKLKIDIKELKIRPEINYENLYNALWKKPISKNHNRKHKE